MTTPNNVYAFAITTDKGSLDTQGQVLLIHLHALFRELHVAFDTKKIRLHTRKPTHDAIRMPYSSIALHLKEAPNAEAPNAEAPNAEAPNAEAPNAEAPNAEASMAEKLRAIVQKRAPIYQDQYVITPMVQYNGQAFVVHDGLTDCARYHNEWFSQPIGDGPFLEYGTSGVQDPPNKQYNRIFGYTPEHGFIRVYRGNNVHTSWIAYKQEGTLWAAPNCNATQQNKDNTHVTYYMRNRLSNAAEQGIYDGIREQVIYNKIIPATTNDSAKDCTNRISMLFKDKFDESEFTASTAYWVQDAASLASLRQKVQEALKIMDMSLKHTLHPDYFSMGKAIQHDGHTVHVIYERT